VLSYLYVRQPDGFQMTSVDVGREHPAARADALRQPAGDRAEAATDFEALPGLADSSRRKMAHRTRIEHVRQRGKTRRGLRGGIVEDIHQRPLSRPGGGRPTIRAISSTCLR
jgi:hypothetical protein